MTFLGVIMPNVRVGNIDLYYETLGKDNPLLMIMGLKFSLLDWGEKLPQKLAEKYQVILFDSTIVLISLS